VLYGINVTSFYSDYTLNAGTTTAAIAVTCQLMEYNIIDLDVTEVTSTDSAVSRLVRRFAAASSSSSRSVQLSYVISVNEPGESYSTLTNRLADSVTNSIFTNNLNTEASLGSATKLQGCYSNAVTITYIDGTMISEPNHDPFHTVSVLLSLSIGVIICLVVAASYYVRSFSCQHLESSMDDVKSLSPTVLIKALSASMVLYQLIVQSDHRTIFVLWLSRCVEGIGWLIIMYLLLVPSKRVDTTSQVSVNMIPLSLKLYGPAVGYGAKVDSVNNFCNFRLFAVTTNIFLLIVCAWDVTLIPLLPWRKTSTTELLNGYPSLTTCRVCLYAPLTTQTLQLLYSIFLLLNSDDRSYGDYLFEVATLIYWLYTAIKTALFIQFTRNEKLKLAIVSVNDLRKFADADAFQVTLMGKEDMNQLRQYLQERTMETMDATIGTIESGPESAEGMEMSLHQTPSELQESKDGPEESKETLDSLELSFDDNQNIDFEEIQEAENLLEYRTAIPFAEETTEILRHQLRDAGILPLTYIPKEQLQAEINELIAAANNGAPFDEARLDYLLKCLDVNPEYQVYYLCISSSHCT
jgi:hypothetical protein